MVYRETAPTGDDQPAVMHDYAGIWQAGDKVADSSTLDAPGHDALPGGLHCELQLLDERRFGNGVVYLRYRIG